MRDRFTEYLKGLYVRPQVPNRFAAYDIAAAQQRLLRRSGTTAHSILRTGGTGAVADLPEPGPETAAVPPLRSTWLDPRFDQPADAEEARRALKTLSLRTVFGPSTGLALHDLVSKGPTDANGVLVFACLLHLLGHEGAQFWWQFAAAAGSQTATYCLFLEHSRHGEYNDAQVWAQQLDPRTFDPQRWWGSYSDTKARKPLPPTLVTHINAFDDDILGVIAVAGPALPYAVNDIVEPQVPPYVAARTEEPGAPAEDKPTPETDTRWPWLTLPHPDNPHSANQSDALLQARTAETVVTTLERHPLGATFSQLARESGVPTGQLDGIMLMLVEEEFATKIADRRVYFPGPALTRLATPDGTSLQLQHTLALARDSAGAAVYLGRYIDGEVHITQMADGPVTPAVNEWVDFRSAAHASAVGKCLLTQLDPRTRADHLTRHKAARLTHRTITSPKKLFDRLDRITPNDPVFDLREYSPHTVCAAVPITVGTEAGTLALSLPHSSAHRLKQATQTLADKAVPVLLALLLAGAKLPRPAGHLAKELPGTGNNVISQAAFERMRRVFRTPLVTTSAIRKASHSPAPGPHLAAEPTEALYLFAAAPPQALGPGDAQLALPHAYTVQRVTDLHQHHSTSTGTRMLPDPLMVFET